MTNCPQLLILLLRITDRDPFSFLFIETQSLLAEDLILMNTHSISRLTRSEAACPSGGKVYIASETGLVYKSGIAYSVNGVKTWSTMRLGRCLSAPPWSFTLSIPPFVGNFALSLSFPG